MLLLLTETRAPAECRTGWSVGAAGRCPTHPPGKRTPTYVSLTYGDHRGVAFVLRGRDPLCLRQGNREAPRRERENRRLVAHPRLHAQTPNSLSRAPCSSSISLPTRKETLGATRGFSNLRSPPPDSEALAWKVPGPSAAGGWREGSWTSRCCPRSMPSSPTRFAW
jgi:hypothetical protein